ncbi:hypothetical protein Cgig2_007484 [Carnegiea gigantea]|uniref:Uncharacterized protein n=1 Tax=Carnegiea gigantea TaxID=171969 RepID=A0A9Q1K715_9CARY|nr:hypothetical protein Cgig2_007484 [Carnegiea gigantea]
MVEELVNVPSEDELCEECPDVGSCEPDQEECALGPQLVWGLHAGGRLRLCHPTDLEVGHLVSNCDLSRVCYLHLRTKNAWGGGILAAGPRGRARLKKGNGIGNLFWLPTLILSGDDSLHPAINKGRKARELRVPTLHLGASLPLTDVPTRRAR